MEFSIKEIKELFTNAAQYSDENSTCRKVHVGSAFVTYDGRIFYACNNGGTENCNKLGYCYKAEKTGIYESCEETRKYCQSVHSEINMLKLLKENNINPSEGTLLVTRYPCEGCTKACIEAGINDIRYCGVRHLANNSNDAAKWLHDANVRVEWYPEFDFEFNKE